MSTSSYLKVLLPQGLDSPCFTKNNKECTIGASDILVGTCQNVMLQVHDLCSDDENQTTHRCV